MRRTSETQQMTEDVWIPSVCNICYNQCGIRVHRVNGVAVKIEGNPESPVGLGRLCAKGMSGLMMAYDPHRVTTPLKRTNPAKDFLEDPGWAPISWDEALDIIAEKLRKLRAEDPRKLLCTGTALGAGNVIYWLYNFFMSGFGSPNGFNPNGHQCGNAEHTLSGVLHGAITSMPDLDHCNYLLVFGSGVGGHAYYAFTTLTQKMADARVRGMKLVVVDPVLNGVAEKADEWVPIRPGTDGAMAMAMLNVLLNEQGMFDAEYLRRHTNAPYLIGPDGLCVRDGQTAKPLLWDEADGRPKPYDDPSLRSPALEGTFTVQGTACRPAFVLLKERAALFSPEQAAEATSVPAHTIRRIATEFAQAARIGSTIEIDGETLPYRPACVTYFKGAHGHNHAWLTCLALQLLNEAVGAADVPGGLLGTNPVCHGYPRTGMPHWAPLEGPDGIISPGVWGGATGRTPRSLCPYPPQEPVPPTRANLSDLLTTGVASGHTPVLALRDLERFRIPYTPEVLINWGTNLVVSLGDPMATAEFLRQLFVVSVKLWLDETTYFADIVLPDACYLERLDPMPNIFSHHFPVGLGEWGHQLRQPVVKPPGQCRDFKEVMLELADRVGFIGDFNALFNYFYGLTPPHALKHDRRYTVEEMADRLFQAYCGQEHGLAWFKEHGVFTWPKKAGEVYWKSTCHARAPIYWEWMKGIGGKISAILGELGIKEIDTSDYDPLPGWKPCAALQAKDRTYDLQAVYHRVAHHSFSFTFQNPWLDEVSAQDPYTNFITVNPATAKRKGVKEGDLVWVRSKEAGSVLARVHLAEGIHPEVVAIANNGGLWSRYTPVAQGKGVFFEALLPTDWAHTDPVAMAMDCDSAVRLEKAGPEARRHARGWEPKRRSSGEATA